MRNKYWRQRYDLFHQFDKGCILDEEGWYSVTPESIAKHIAERCRGYSKVFDGFVGAGGNLIQFGLVVKKVIGMDIDPNKLKITRHNAEIYEIPESKMKLIEGNFFEDAHKVKADVVFCSPPWGGPSYTNQEIFDLTSIRIHEIYSIARSISKNVILFLPRNSDIDQLVELAGSQPIEIEESFVHYPTHSSPALKAITVYFGDLVRYCSVVESVEYR